MKWLEMLVEKKKINQMGILGLKNKQSKIFTG